MDPADNMRRNVLVRESRRSQARTEQLAADLADPVLAPYLAEVDRRWPNLADFERLRLARILRGMTGMTPIRYSRILGAVTTGGTT